MQDDETNQSTGSRIQDFPTTGQGSDGGAGYGEKSRTAAVKDKARETKDRVMNKGSDALHQARERTRHFADERKNQLGERIHGYGSAFRRAADKLRDEEDPNIAHYTQMVADRIDQAADYVRSRDAGMLMRDVENLVRRRPEIFFGGMFLAGLVIARFLKASNQRDDVYRDEHEEDYWVEDQSYEESSELGSPVDPNPAMTPGEAASDWRYQTPGGSGNLGGGNI